MKLGRLLSVLVLAAGLVAARPTPAPAVAGVSPLAVSIAEMHLVAVGPGIIGGKNVAIPVRGTGKIVLPHASRQALQRLPPFQSTQ